MTPNALFYEKKRATIDRSAPSTDPWERASAIFTRKKKRGKEDRAIYFLEGEKPDTRILRQDGRQGNT